MTESRQLLQRFVAAVAYRAKPYVWAFLLGGVVLPCILHAIASEKMPWWPDAISLGIAFGVTAALIAWKTPKDREMNRRIWNTVKELTRDRRSKLTKTDRAESNASRDRSDTPRRNIRA